MGLGMEARRYVKWLPERDAELRAHFDAGRGDQEIARAMGIGFMAVRHRRHHIGVLRRGHCKTRIDEGRWTSEINSRLTELWASGLRAALIAQELGDGFTKNAVIGKARRLNLPPRPNGRIPGQPSQKRKPRVTRSYPFRAPPQLRLVVDNTRDEDIPIAQRKSFVELTADACRWMVGDPQGEHFYCGGETAGGSWCPSHHKACFQSSFKSLGDCVNRVVEKLERQRRDNAKQA